METASSLQQLAAAKRRERILRNSENRMKLVTGKTEQLEDAPGKQYFFSRFEISECFPLRGKRYCGNV